MKTTLFEQVFELNRKYMEQEFGRKTLERATFKAFDTIAHRLMIDRNDFNEPKEMTERKKRYGRDIK